MPEYGPSALSPTSVTHVHTYPPPGSPSIPDTKGDGKPLRQPYDPASQYAPSQPIHVPASGAPSRHTRASRAPTVPTLEVTGPEPIQTHPPQDQDQERGVSTRNLSPSRVWAHIKELPRTGLCIEDSVL
ncbi:hypothetical protein EI94DRAFT_1809354 [Lactarius quietus]|nr:hypothetical protein EI94DRAFT_1809354 [Lactarius quietus]